MIGPLLALFALAQGQELVPPTILECATPLYPAGIDAGPQRVTALLRIGPDGEVERVSELAGDPRFVALIDPVAADCTFSPAIEDGTAITVDQPFAWDWAAPVDNLGGVLLTRGDRRPVEGALVALRRPELGEDPERTTTTDADGRFAFRNIGSGTIYVDVLVRGLRVPRLELEGPQEPGDVIDLELWAFRERQSSDELVAVYDPRAPGPTRRTIERDAIRAVPGSLGDPVRALLTQPGFTRAPFEAGWLLVRGGDLNDTGLYLDGVRIPLLYHMGGFTSVLHPELTQSVDYWAGAQPARLQATAGAVDVTPADIGTDGRVVAGVNTAWAHGFVEVPTEWGGVAFAARRAYLDGVLALVLGSEAASIAPRFADVQGTVQIGDARFTGLWLGDALEVPSLDGGTLRVVQVGAQLQGRIPVDVGKGEIIVWPWIASHGRGLDAVDENDTLTGGQSLIERFPGLRVAWRSSQTAELRLEAGFEAEYRSWRLKLDTRNFHAPGGRIDPYVQAIAGRKVQIETGIRMDTLWVREQLPRAELSPRTSVRWNATKGLSLHTEFGRFHAIPEVLLIAGLPEGAYLPLERSDLLAAGFRARRDAWSVEADVYQRQMAWIASLELDSSLAQHIGRAYGVETQVAWRPEPVALSVVYQYGRSERRDMREGDPFPTLFDQPHRLQLLAVAHLPRSWTLSGRFRYGSGFPRSTDPITGAPIPSEALDLLTQEIVPLPADSGDRLAAFHSLDIKLLREVQLRTWRLDFWIDVQNVYNRRVVEPFLTGFPESSVTYGYGLPVLPIFGVEGVWWPRKGPVKPESGSSTPD